MSRSKSKSLVPSKAHLFAMGGNMKRLGNIYDAEDAVADIEGLCVDERITQSDLPKVVPPVLRKIIADHSAKLSLMRQQLEDTLADLEIYGNQILDELDKEEEAKKAHCKSCGQVLPSSKKRSR